MPAMPARRSIRLKRKTIDDAEEFLAATQPDTFKKESSPVLDHGEDVDELCPGLGLDTDDDDTPTPPVTPETPPFVNSGAGTPEPSTTPSTARAPSMTPS